VLFSSFEFLFLFLPACLAAAFIARGFGARAVVIVTLLSSLYFYGYFRPSYLLLLALSITVNYFGGEQLIRTRSRPVLTALVIFNLGLLGVFKYLDFVLYSLDFVVPAELPRYGIMLPLAISFFTFQQIAYVCDCYRGQTIRNDFVQYALLVSFFPHLIAGPIVRQQEVMQDIVDGRLYPTLERIGYGLSIVAIGLFKKVFFADQFADIADPIFDANTAGEAISRADAWVGLLAYTLQIYFDFSGYSDMAIGLAAMFGLRFPVNFLSPYKARSIIDFWHRWHMTLSAFLRDYFYFALGGNRNGKVRRYANLMIVMLVGGLWHGADWAFMLWGGIHGTLLVINHGARHVLADLKNPLVERAAGIAAPVLTFAAVCLAWVPFRANGVAWVDYYAALWSGPAGSEMHTGTLALLAFGYFVVWMLPNLAQFFGYDVRTQGKAAVAAAAPSRLRWQPATTWAVVSAFVLLASLHLVLRQPPNAFIYFQF